MLNTVLFYGGLAGIFIVFGYLVFRRQDENQDTK
jgi:hypothetical protein